MAKVRIGASVAVAATLGAVGFAVIATAPAGASPWESFDVVAAADGARVTTFVPGGPLNDRVFDIGAPRAQARVDGLGTATGFAAGLHPDDLVLNVPGIAAGATKQDVPPYPLIAASSYPAHPNATVDDGVVVLRSESESDRATASAIDGLTGTTASGARVTAEAYRRRDATLVATATSTVEGITVGPLTIGRLASSATTERAVDGTRTRKSATVLTGVTVGDAAVTIDRSRLAAADPALAALAAGGVTLRWLDEVKSSAGVTAPGVEITLTVPASLTGSGTSSVTWTFGRALAQASGVPGSAVSAGRLADDRAGNCCAGSIVASAADSLTPGSGALVPTTPGAAVAGGLRGVPVVRVVPETWPADFYVVFIGAAALVGLAAFALHVLGVRLRWGS